MSTSRLSRPLRSRERCSHRPPKMTLLGLILISGAFANSRDILTLADKKSRTTHTANTLKFLHTATTRYTVKCVDTETGKVVGMALWDIYLTPSEWKKGGISWLQGKEKERAEPLVNPLWDARELLWNNERYVYCNVLAVHPDYQRRGIGELIFKYGMGIAEQVQLPIYIESSKEAQRLYEKMGCRRLKARPVYKFGDLGSDETDGSKEDRGAVLYVWIPSGKTEILPEKVELAA